MDLDCPLWGEKFVLAMVQEHGFRAVDKADKTASVWADKDVVLRLLETFQRSDLMVHKILQFAADSLAQDKEVVQSAIAADTMSLQYSAKADKDVVQAAVAKNAMSPQHAANSAKADKDLVLAVVASNGLAMQFAADSMKSDDSCRLKWHCCALRSRLHQSRRR